MAQNKTQVEPWSFQTVSNVKGRQAEVVTYTKALARVLKTTLPARDGHYGRLVQAGVSEWLCLHCSWEGDPALT